MQSANDNGAPGVRATLKVSVYGMDVVLSERDSDGSWQLGRIIVGPNGMALRDRLFAAQPHPACPQPRLALPSPVQAAVGRKKRPAFIRGVHQGAAS